MDSVFGSSVDLLTIALLRAVGDDGSITAAAHRFGITQQAASARLRKAERSLERQLTERGADGTRLTQAGRLIVEWGVPVLDATQRLHASIATMQHTQSSHTIAASQTIAEHLLPGWLHRAYPPRGPDAPRLLSGNSSQVLELIADGTAQLGFVETPRIPTAFYQAPLTHDDLAVLVAPQHPWATRSALTGAELAAAPLLMRESGSGTRDAFETWLADHHLERVDAAAELGTTTALIAAARAAQGVAVLSERAVEHELGAGTLIRVPTVTPIRRTLTAVWLTRRLPVPLQELVAIAAHPE